MSCFLPSPVAIETPGGDGDWAGREGKALENSKGQFRRYWLTGKIRVRRERVPWLDVNRKSSRVGRGEGVQGGKDTLSSTSLPKEVCSAFVQPRWGLKVCRGSSLWVTQNGGDSPSWTALWCWGSPASFPDWQQPRAGDRDSRILATCHFGGCQWVLVPVQEPPVRMCWPPVLAAPVRMVVSARSQRTTRASPAVAPLAGKVWTWPFWGS